MKTIRLNNNLFEIPATLAVIDLIKKEVDDKLCSWGMGFHDIWVALYYTIEG